jgi:hypothetical protein
MTARRLLPITLIACALALVACGGDKSGDGDGASVRGYQAVSFDGNGHWAPPRLKDPVSVEAGPDQTTLNLDPRRDYVVRVSKDGRRRDKGLIVNGGHNVVMIGGEIRIGWQGKHANHHLRRGLLLKNQTGTIHVEGLRISGTDLGEGIDLDQRRGATVQLVNLEIGTVTARDTRNFSDTHPDLVQSWAGPKRLRIDGLRGSTAYQGLFLLPRQFDGKLDIEEISLRNVSITGTRTSRYLLWTAGGPRPRISNVWLRGARYRPAKQLFWPRPTVWKGTRLTRRPAGRLPRRPAAGSSYAVPVKRQDGR